MRERISQIVLAVLLCWADRPWPLDRIPATLTARRHRHGHRLIWQQQTGDTNEDGAITTDDEVTWQAALAYCEDLPWLAMTTGGCPIDVNS